MIGSGWRRTGALVLLVAFCLSGLDSAAAADLLSPNQFRDAYVAAIRTARPDLKVTTSGAGEIDLVFPDGHKEFAFIDNAYSRYVSDPSQLRPILERYVAVLFSSAAMDQTSIKIDSLFVTIRPTTYLQLSRARFGKGRDNDGPMTRPFSGDLLEFIAEDTPQTIGIPVRSEVRKATKLTDEELWAQALATGAKLHGPLDVKVIAPGLVVVGANQSMASTTLLDGSLLAIPEVRAFGGRFAVLIGKDSILVGKTDDLSAIEAMRSLGQKFPADWVSGTLYAPAAGGGWRDWDGQ